MCLNRLHRLQDSASDLTCTLRAGAVEPERQAVVVEASAVMVEGYQSVSSFPHGWQQV